MISNNLLSSVLGLQSVVRSFNENTNTIIYVFDAIGEKREGKINIFELAYKCKEWAWSKSYISYAGISFDFESNPEYFCSIAIANVLSWKRFVADSEPKAVFTACEFILKDKC